MKILNNMNKDKIFGTLLIGFVFSFSNKIGKDLWNAKISSNKLL